jgi:hypothetical protein
VLDVVVEWDGLEWEIYPDAAWSPRPRDPPVTTATLPLRLKMFAKSWSWTSDSADMRGGYARIAYSV